MEMENQCNRLKLASFNIRLDTPDDGPENGPYRWASRFPLVEKVIKSYGWDIIGFQEVQQKQLDDLLKMKDYCYVGEKRDKGELQEYNPIFYKKTKFELVDSTTIWLSDTPGELSHAWEWGASNPRICTIVQLNCVETGREFIVLNTHFDHLSEKARFYSAKLVMDRINDYSDNYAVFLMGDFNGDESERWYKEVAKGLESSINLSKHHVGPLVTCTGVAFSYRPSWDDMQYIDYIFINNKVDVLNTAIVTDRFGELYPSDHFPVSLECKII